ncbi:hypothetical protein [Microcystis phage MJing1]|nr:hypothetical protein [Microcystis phage MJing1]
MPDTFTPELNLTKVEINGSVDTWGNKLNGNADKVDEFASDTNAALTAALARITALEARPVIPAGLIAKWSGTVATIPTGWALCNGSNGTPDLTDKFVIGAGGTRAPGATGGAASVNTSAAGAHAHGGATQGHTLTAAQIPPHQHTGSTNGAGDHSHGVGQAWANDTSQGSANINFFGTGTVGIRNTTDGVGQHAHSFTTDATGGGQPHTHTITEAPNHQHTVEVLPPFYALAYIMKL